MKTLETPEHSGWKTEAVCENCETRLEIEKADILYGDFYSGMEAEHSMEYYVDCPVCRKYVFLHKEHLPRHVRFAAESKYVPKSRR